ncbi:MAG: hypothetical protein KDB80_17150, partial [Planctomycetes bacterium]|nr:hypothetical protein [Planctomycetota bacterium]
GFSGHSYAVQHHVRGMNSSIRDYDMARQAGAERTERLAILQGALDHAESAANLGLFENGWVEYQRGNIGLQIRPREEWPRFVAILEHSLELLRDTDTEFDVRTALATARAQLGDRDGAFAEMRARLERFPNIERSWLELADTLAGLGDRQSTVEVLETMLQRFPNHPGALARLQAIKEGPK